MLDMNIRTLLTLVFVALSPYLFAQCVPSPGLANANPGFYPDPDSLPCIVQGVNYTARVEFKAPEAVGNIIVDSVTVDSIGNFPNGIFWQTNKASNTFKGGEAGCVDAFGITNSPAGGYPVQFFITLYARGLSPISGEYYNIAGTLGLPVNDTITLKVISFGDTCSNVASSVQSGVIQTRVFFDADGDGVYDPTETPMFGQEVRLNPGNNRVYTDVNGEAYFYVPFGNYNLNLKNNPLFSSTTGGGTIVNISLTPANPTALANDFGLEPKNNTKASVDVDLTTGPARPGFASNHWITYTNTGSTVESGVVSYLAAPDLQFQSASTAPASQAGQQFTFNYSNLNPGEQRRILIIHSLAPDPMLLGDTLCTDVAVTTTSGTNQSNYDTDVDCQVVTGAYDPNDKTCFPETYEVEAEQELTYRIRFQNVGNDTAFNVTIKDTLNEWIEIDSIRIISSSHFNQFNIEGGSVMTWQFPNIQLPDSSVNEPGSHGFVVFRTYLKDAVPQGQVFSNRAGIFFDFFDPIITNTAENKVKEDSIIISVASITASDYTIYPNPANQSIRIKGLVGSASLQLFDIRGAQVIGSAVNASSVIGTAELSDGVYFYSITSNDGAVSRGKLIVQK